MSRPPTDSAQSRHYGEPLSVLFVCQHDLTGPSEKQMMGFAQQLASWGHKVMFSFGTDGGSQRREGLLIGPGITLHEHRFAGRRLRPGDRQIALGFQPSLIHAVNSRVPTAAATADYARATGSPVFVHFEDNEWSPWRGVPGESAYYRLGRHIRRLESFISPASWPHSTARTRRWVRRDAAALDALTPELAQEVERRLGRSCATLLPVTPRLDAADSAREVELPEPLARLPLAMVTGTIYPFSLDDTLQGLRAVAQVQRAGYELGYVHPGNIHPRIDASELAEQAGLMPGTYVFPGQLGYGRIGPLLKRATVLLQPGAPSEFNRLRLPSKLQTYLASGVPTITFSVGFGRMLGDDEALKIRTSEPAELAAQIIRLLADDSLRATLAVGARRAAERLFNRERNTGLLLGHYRSALENHPRVLSRLASA
jgi:glycosyltransferase involved in cell wall biosynthesis